MGVATVSVGVLAGAAFAAGSTLFAPLSFAPLSAANRGSSSVCAAASADEDGDEGDAGVAVVAGPEPASLDAPSCDVRRAVPVGAGLGGRTFRFRSSTSRFEISCSIWDLNSFEARRNSFIHLPAWRAISGNFLGPKMMSARKNRKIVSEKLMGFIILPQAEKRQCERDTVLTRFSARS